MLERLSGSIEALGTRLVIDWTFVQDIVAALRYLESGRHIGTVVVRVTGSNFRS